jgi:hypothetical protein
LGWAPSCSSAIDASCCRMFVTFIPHHETFSATIQPPYSSTKG